MKDNETRGLVLKALYDVRHVAFMPALPAQVPGLPSLDRNLLRNIVVQLKDKGLIEFMHLSGGDNMIGRAKITAYGIDVVEGAIVSPIAISIDQSVNVHGSQNVQVGGHDNVQNVSMDIEKMISVVDSADASVTEKEEAKSLLKRISENKLVQMVIGGWLKSQVPG